MTDSSVEAVARALHKHEWDGQPEPDNFATDRDYWMSAARAAIRAIEATALRDDTEWLVTAAGHLQRCCEQSYSRSTMTQVSTGTLVDIADRLERIASRLRSPSPDGEAMISARSGG